MPLTNEQINEWWKRPILTWRNYGPTMTNREEREFQQEKAYRSERQWRKEGIENDCTFLTKEEVEKYVRKVVAYKWFQRRFGVLVAQKIKLFFNNISNCQASYPACAMYFPSTPGKPCRSDPTVIWDAWTKRVILHELAHVVTPTRSGGGHGRFWARAYLDLVDHELGYRAGQQLRKHFKENNVKYQPKRQLTQKQREAARQRFQKMLDNHSMRS